MSKHIGKGNPKVGSFESKDACYRGFAGFFLRQQQIYSVMPNAFRYTDNLLIEAKVEEYAEIFENSRENIFLKEVTVDVKWKIEIIYLGLTLT